MGHIKVPGSAVPRRVQYLKRGGWRSEPVPLPEKAGWYVCSDAAMLAGPYHSREAALEHVEL